MVGTLPLRRAVQVAAKGGMLGLLTGCQLVGMPPNVCMGVICTHVPTMCPKSYGDKKCI